MNKDMGKLYKRLVGLLIAFILSCVPTIIFIYIYINKDDTNFIDSLRDKYEVLKPIGIIFLVISFIAVPIFLLIIIGCIFSISNEAYRRALTAEQKRLTEEAEAEQRYLGQIEQQIAIVAKNTQQHIAKIATAAEEKWQTAATRDVDIETKHQIIEGIVPIVAEAERQIATSEINARQRIQEIAAAAEDGEWKHIEGTTEAEEAVRRHLPTIERAAKDARQCLSEITEKKETEQKRLAVIAAEREAERKHLAEEAVIKEAAEQGGGAEKYALAKYYYGKNQYEEALKWCWRAAKKNHIPAFHELYCTFRDGTYGTYSVEKNMSKAVEFLEQAANQGDAKSQYDLVWLYYFGYGELESDSEQAAYWFSKITEQSGELAELAHAQICFEELMKNGGWSESYAKQIFRMFNKILEEYKNPLAAIYLGEMYCMGIGTYITPDTGANYIEEGMKHIKESLTPAQYFRLAKLFFEGKTSKDGSQNVWKAYVYIEKAFVNGDEEIAEYYKYVKREYVKKELERAEDNAKSHAEWSCKYCNNKTEENSYTDILHSYVGTSIKCIYGYSEYRSYNGESKIYGYGEGSCPKHKEYFQKVENLKNELKILENPPSLAKNNKNDIFDW